MDDLYIYWLKFNWGVDYKVRDGTVLIACRRHYLPTYPRTHGVRRRPAFSSTAATCQHGCAINASALYARPVVVHTCAHSCCANSSLSVALPSYALPFAFPGRCIYLYALFAHRTTTTPRGINP